MIVGTTIWWIDGTPFYTPQFQRGGLAGNFIAQVTHKAGNNDATMTVETRNSEDTSWTTVDSATITTTGKVEVGGSSIKELLRIKFSWASGAASDVVHVIVQAPTWRPYT